MGLQGGAVSLTICPTPWGGADEVWGHVAVGWLRPCASQLWGGGLTQRIPVEWWPCGQILGWAEAVG